MDRTAYLETIRHHFKTAYLLSDKQTETMLPRFLVTLRSHTSRLTELAVEGDLEQLERASHAVKGALLNMGLADLAETAQTIEKMCRNRHNGAHHQALIADLHATVLRLGEGW